LLVADVAATSGVEPFVAKINATASVEVSNTANAIAAIVRVGRAWFLMLVSRRFSRPTRSSANPKRSSA
jgi:hypothetical protein